MDGSLTLTHDGWVPVDQLLSALARHGTHITREQLEQVVAGNDKQRFTLDGNRIRASQGHSLDVDLGLTPATPPDPLFHGTATRNIDSILREGILRRQRHHVHLSADDATARAVGARYGKPAVLKVDAAAMSHDGHVFYRSANGVWLTEHVPPSYLII